MFREASEQRGNSRPPLQPKVPNLMFKQPGFSLRFLFARHRLSPSTRPPLQPKVPNLMFKQPGFSLRFLFARHRLYPSPQPGPPGPSGGLADPFLSICRDVTKARARRLILLGFPAVAAAPGP